MTRQYYGHQGPAVGSGQRRLSTADAEYLRNLQTIAVKMAAFLARLQGDDHVPLDVAEAGMVLVREYKRIDSGRNQPAKGGES